MLSRTAHARGLRKKRGTLWIKGHFGEQHAGLVVSILLRQVGHIIRARKEESSSRLLAYQRKKSFRCIVLVWKQEAACQAMPLPQTAHRYFRRTPQWRYLITPTLFVYFVQYLLPAAVPFLSSSLFSGGEPSEIIVQSRLGRSHLFLSIHIYRPHHSGKDTAL